MAAGKQEPNDPRSFSDEESRIFTTPWEARVFAQTAYMAEHGEFRWESFRDRLIDKINEGDAHADVSNHDLGTPYYRAWLKAFEALLADSGLCTADDLEKMIAALSGPDAPGKRSPTGKIARSIAEQ